MNERYMLARCGAGGAHSPRRIDEGVNPQGGGEA